jgi:hypothetical protein
VHLTRSRDRSREIDALARAAGGRVALDGVLADLNRRARRVRRWGSAFAFAWDWDDSRSSRWWPQGITSSADAGSAVAPAEEYAGRRVLVTSSYSKVLRGTGRGARVTVVDVTEPGRLPYRHVLLVSAHLEEHRPTLRPVAAHAGGIVWRGPWLHVAGTAKGIHSFHLDDIVAVGGADRPDVLGALPGGGLAGFGHRYVLPARFTHTGHAADGSERFRYSFLSLARGEGPPRLLAGEYGRAGMTTRLVRYDLDAEGLPVCDESSVARPSFLHDGGVPRMQGAVEVDGRLHVTTSAGRLRRGSLWVGRPGDLVRHRWAVPAGPEDLCYWPSEDRLWTVTEYPWRRTVLALDRSRFT